MRVTPRQCADLCRDLYDPVPVGRFVQMWTYDNVVVGLAKIDDYCIFVLRGSVTVEDWMRDLSSEFPVWHPRIGFCGAGFAADMDAVYAEIIAAVYETPMAKVVITGHSLGGARARILAAMFAVNGVQVDTLCVFGSPKPAFVNLARIIQKSGMIHLSHRNRNDIVPTVPLTALPLLDFVHTEDWIALNAASAETNLDPLRDHSIDLYVQALTP